jgi:hypothetical protein
VSSHFRAIGVRECVESSVLGRVVGDAELPTVQDDVQPGTGEDANGMRVVVASSASLLVEIGRPRIGVAGVGSEVTNGIPELLVSSPTESDRTMLARLASTRRDAGQASQRLGGWEASSAIADLGEEACGADTARAGQAGEQLGIRMGGELFCDLLVKGPDLVDHTAEDSQEGAGDVGQGSAFCASGAWGGGQPSVQSRRINLPEYPTVASQS